MHQDGLSFLKKHFNDGGLNFSVGDYKPFHFPVFCLFLMLARTYLVLVRTDLVLALIYLVLAPMYLVLARISVGASKNCIFQRLLDVFQCWRKSVQCWRLCIQCWRTSVQCWRPCIQCWRKKTLKTNTFKAFPYEIHRPKRSTTLKKHPRALTLFSDHFGTKIEKTMFHTKSRIQCWR